MPTLPFLVQFSADDYKDDEIIERESDDSDIVFSTSDKKACIELIIEFFSSTLLVYYFI